MNPQEYIKNCLVTESPVSDAMKDRLTNNDNIRLLHSALGLCTEASEFADQMKKHLFYGKPLDLVNLKEEIQDCLWYISVAMDVLEHTYEEAMERNIEKLAARYPDKFTEFHANNRDLKTERKILEK